MKSHFAIILVLCVLVSAALSAVLKDKPSQEKSSHALESVNLLDDAKPRVARSAGYPGRSEYVMYHGTTEAAAASIIKTGFRPSSGGMLGPGVYVSRDIRKAQHYPHNLPAHLRVILKVNVRVGKVKRIDRQGHPLQTTWHAHGYDTAWVPPNCGMVASGLTENCIWDPKRIKVLDVVQGPPQAVANLKSLLNMMNG